MKNKLVVFITILSFIVIALSVLLFAGYKRYNTPYLKTMTILGEEVKILPNVYIYDLHMKSGKINKVSGGCKLPFEFEVNNIFKKKYEETGYSGVNYFVAGEDYAYFSLDFEEYDIEKGKVTRIDARYYFKITFDEPLEIDDFCK